MKRKLQSKTKASVLIAVLGIIALVSALLVSFLWEATDRIRYNGLAQNGGDLRERAYGALEVSLASIAQIAEIDNGLRATSQGWGDPLQYAGFTPYDDCEVSVTCTDESAKLPLAAMNAQQISTLFEQMDLSSSDADKLAQSLIDWMDDNDTAQLDGMDGDDYEKAEIPCKPSNMVPRSWEEFALMDRFPAFFRDEKGAPTQLFTDFTNAVSLYNDAGVNVNDASDLVLNALGELGGFEWEQAVKNMEGFDGIRGTADDKILASASDLGTGSAPLATFSAQLIRLRVVASRGETHFALDILLKYSGPAKVTNAATGTSTKLSGGYEDFPDNPESVLAYPFTILQLTETRMAP
jgi:general secretion pathway protein K